MVASSQQRASRPAIMAKGDASAVHRNPCRVFTGSVWLRTGSLSVRTWAIYHSGSLISPRREVRVGSP